MMLIHTHQLNAGVLNKTLTMGLITPAETLCSLISNKRFVIHNVLINAGPISYCVINGTGIGTFLTNYEVLCGPTTISKPLCIFCITERGRRVVPNITKPQHTNTQVTQHINIKTHQHATHQQHNTPTALHNNTQHTNSTANQHATHVPTAQHTNTQHTNSIAHRHTKHQHTTHQHATHQQHSTPTRNTPSA